MVDINKIESITGKKGINLGLTGVGFAENYLLFDQFIKNNNSVKNILVQVDMHNLNSKKELVYPFHNYNYMHLLNDKEVYETFKDNSDLLSLLLWKYIPFTRYMEFSNKYVFYKIAKGGFECTSSDVYDPSKGSEIMTPKDFKAQRTNYLYWTLNENDKKYLEKLTAFAQEKKIKVIYYTAPIYARYSHFELNFKNILHQEKLLAANKKIPFFDFSSTDNALCKNVNDFNDYIHMNTTGVEKFSKALADSIGPLMN